MRAAIAGNLAKGPKTCYGFDMPFQPGNKHGRGRKPAGHSLTEAIRLALREKSVDGRRADRVIADVLVAKAMEGNLVAIREILDRVEGKPVSLAPENRPESNPIVIHFAKDSIGLL
jgi:hypothetical protein